MRKCPHTTGPALHSTETPSTASRGGLIHLKRAIAFGSTHAELSSTPPMIPSGLSTPVKQNWHALRWGSVNREVSLIKCRVRPHKSLHLITSTRGKGGPSWECGGQSKIIHQLDGAYLRNRSKIAAVHLQTADNSKQIYKIPKPWRERGKYGVREREGKKRSERERERERGGANTDELTY